MSRTSHRTYQRNRARVLVPGCVCHICGKEIDLTIEDPYDPGYGTADHVVPVAHGGTNHLSNLAASHRACNLARQTKPLDAVRPRRRSRKW